MTVYVDNARVRTGRRQYPVCHMAADTLEELHLFVAVAQVVGYFNDDPEQPHFEVNDWQRRYAIQCGAVEVQTGELFTVALCAKLNAS